MLRILVIARCSSAAWNKSKTELKTMLRLGSAVTPWAPQGSLKLAAEGLGAMLCIWEEQLFPAALLSGMELHRAGANCISGNQSSRHRGCLLVFASPRCCPSAGSALPCAQGNTSAGGMSLPRDPQATPSIFPFPQLYPAVQA